MSRYVLTTQAQEDLQQIRDHLLEKAGLRVARHVMASLVAALHALVRAPGQGHRREDLSSREELRFWNVFSYFIVYRIDKRPLTVIAILHGTRDVERLLEER